MYKDDEDNSQRLGLMVTGIITAAVVAAVRFEKETVWLSHTPQGSPASACGQFRLLAKMRAMVVLPTPRVPVSK